MPTHNEIHTKSHRDGNVHGATNASHYFETENAAFTDTKSKNETPAPADAERNRFSSVTPESLSAAVAAGRYESARRIGHHLLNIGTASTRETVLHFHDALVKLGDFQAALGFLSSPRYAKLFDDFTTALCFARDFHHLAATDHYRISSEVAQGFTYDEYQKKYETLSAVKFVEARKLACTDEQKLTLQEALLECGRSSIALKPLTFHTPHVSTSPSTIRGTVLLERGHAAHPARVTLGLCVKSDLDSPVIPEIQGLGYVPEMGPFETRTAETDEQGRFVIHDVPAGTHDYLAVTLNPVEFEIPTHFLARHIQVAPDDETDMGSLVIHEWRSAPPETTLSPHPQSLYDWTKIAEIPLHNPFAYDFPRQLLHIPLPADVLGDPAALRVTIIPNSSEPFQISDGGIVLLTGLPAKSRCWIAVYKGSTHTHQEQISSLFLEKESDAVWRIETGSALFRIAGEKPDNLQPPILQVCGSDGAWRGAGKFRLPEGAALISQSSRIVENGAVMLKIEISYLFNNGKQWSVILTALAGEPYLLVHEKSENWEHAAFEFSLREFSGGRGYLHWLTGKRAIHWTTLESRNREVGQLPESIPWWIPPQGFGYAMTQDGLDGQDYIAVFTIRRGEWIDRQFERLAHGPVDANGQENRELDWPYPEMVGSSISRITAQTSEDGDAFFRFGMFDGERHWGLLVSTLDQNDGPDKHLASVQHANSSPRLQDFKDWHLDVQDSVLRPYLLASRSELGKLRHKCHHPRFSRIWTKIRSGNVPGAVAGLRFALEGDPTVAWRRRIELLASARVRTRMTLLGRDRGDLYSPVGGRGITPDAADFDLVAASGVFSPEEEREVRAHLILMGHMYMECDLMNWHYNARNANFEADRVEIVGTIGLAFAGHPDAGKFLTHVIERTKSSLEAYCTEGSGKWYENPACYYLHASKCRVALLYHLAKANHIRLEEIPRLKDFLRWGITLLTPFQPVSYAVMRDGTEERFLSTEKVRKIPPIGDHASIGRWLPEHYAFIGKQFMESDPDFGRELVDAYFLASGDGARLLAPSSALIEQEGEQLFHGSCAGTPAGNLPLLFTVLDEEDIPAQPKVSLTSRKLEGFGAVIRDHVATPEEVYLLIKQGPGGYRYHRTEGSFLFFAEGRPLVYDGGEAGETWRHSTLSFFDTHLPLSAGHVERCFFDPSFQFVQGVHPEVVRPGEPVFLSDDCDHRLVSECYRRFGKEPPAAVRSFVWIGGKLIVHDALQIDDAVPRHWHLQVVADAEEGTSSSGYRFKGRFGLDLAVQFPGQVFQKEFVERLPIHEYSATPDQCFAMRHLQLSGGSSHLAVMMPLKSGEALNLYTESFSVGETLTGVRIETANTEEMIWFSREGCLWSGNDVHFEGKYGAFLDRPDSRSLVLIGKGKLSFRDFRLESQGPNAILTQQKDGVFLRSEGNGEIVVHLGKKRFVVCVKGRELSQLR